MRRIIPIILALVLPMSLCAATKKKTTQQTTASSAITKPIEALNFPQYTPFVKSVYKVTKATIVGKELTVFLEDAFSNLPFTEEIVDSAYDSLRSQMPADMRKYNLHIVSHNLPIERYVPNFKRKRLPQDQHRRGSFQTAFNVVINADRPQPIAGLQNRNIAIWNSHGLYFNNKAERWEWQRPRMFGTVEDLLTTSIIIPYLMPMLQNAGAEVFMPRERDINNNEYVFTKTSDVFVADVTQKGIYWIKIKYKKGKEKAAELAVDHAGVESHYKLNTTVGYGTWIYIDNLFLDGYTKLSFPKEAEIDSVVAGGGMSHNLSGYPRFMEAAVYNLRENGLPDSITVNQKKGVKSDYYDDIYSRSKWVNFLTGGSDRYPSYPGLEIPIDLSFALHTDAFVLDSDAVVGSLLICTSDTVFPSKYSRMASHDLANYVGHQFMDDLKGYGIENWHWRGIWHQNYVETRVPMVPAVLLEAFSHQNFADMKLGNKPEFKFRLARSIYKAMLRFLAEQNNETYVVQPLAVKSFSSDLIAADSVRLSWLPVSDPLEPTAYPTKYILYTRIGDESFDNGQVINSNSVTLHIKKNTLYSYKVCASNNGGDSFPSEVLSVYSNGSTAKKALIVNGFDRVSGAGTFDFGQFSGFNYDTDFGVPYMYDVAYTGPQIEFNRSVAFANNDYPGFGASLGNYETQVIAGNTFDYTFVHGKALKECGYSFASMSKDAFMAASNVAGRYTLLDVILGQQRRKDGFEMFPSSLQRAILNFTKAGRKLLLSGAYLGQDGGSFAEKTFSFQLRSPFAATNGKVADPSGCASYSLQMTPSQERYFLQNVDAIDPKYRGTIKLLFYETNRLPAALLYKRNYSSIVVGFPLEALQTQEQINSLMEYLIDSFD